MRTILLLVLTLPLVACGDDGGTLPPLGTDAGRPRPRRDAGVTQLDGGGSATDAGPARDGGGLPLDAGEGCAPECGGRVCGPDPVCGVSCGGCAEGVCTPDGRCEGEASPSGPTVLSLEVTPAIASASDLYAYFSATVDDPDGVTDIFAGSAHDAEGNELALFELVSVSGRYEARAPVASARPTFPDDGPGRATRTFEARFIDRDGNVGSASVTQEVVCGSLDPESSDPYMCGGDCADLNRDRDHCGRCDAAVPEIDGMVCRLGNAECDLHIPDLCDGACTNVRYDEENCGSCGNSCSARGADRCVGASVGRAQCQGRYWAEARQTCAALCAANGMSCVDTSTNHLARYADFVTTTERRGFGCLEDPPRVEGFFLLEMECDCDEGR